jgi:hypothetical protein
MQVSASIRDYGDTSFILSGLFDNAIRMKYTDPSLARSQRASEWLSYADHIDFHAQSKGLYYMQAYIPVVGSALHFFCATESKPKLEWPRKLRVSFF